MGLSVQLVLSDQLAQWALTHQILLFHPVDQLVHLVLVVQLHQPHQEDQFLLSHLKDQMGLMGQEGHQVLVLLEVQVGQRVLSFLVDQLDPLVQSLLCLQVYQMVHEVLRDHVPR